MARKSRQAIEQDKARTLELLAQYRANPSTRLRDEIFELNQPLAHREANRFAKTVDEPLEDLCQVASVGLVKAIARFELSKGHAFSSFACSIIKGELMHHRRDRCTSGGLKVSRTWKEQATRLQKLAAEGRSVQYISEQTGIPIEDIPTAIAATSSRKVGSIDTSRSEDGEYVGIEISTFDRDNSHWCKVAEAFGIIIRRRTDGLIDATLICKSTGRRFIKYWQQERTKKYLESFSEKTVRRSFYETRRGRKGGAWVSDPIAIDLIRWAHPECAQALDLFAANSVIESA